MKQQTIKTNEHALELWNILNSIDPKKGSHQSEAKVKTIRNMKPWMEKHMEILQDIDAMHVATTDVDGVKIILKKVLKRTNKNAKGEETTEEYTEPEYTIDGQKKRTSERRDHLKKDIDNKLTFEVRKTYDDHELNDYQKAALTDLGFLISEEEYKSLGNKEGKKEEEIKGETPTT